MKTKLFLQIILIIVIMVSALFMFSYAVPFNMDEFSYYHVLASRYYPLNILNLFREPSTGYDLAPFSHYYLPLRENIHQGSFSSLLYLPLFLLWPSPYSARLLTLILLAVQAYYLSKIFKTHWVITYLIILAYMPYAFLHICDIGPLSFHTASVILIYFLTQQWLKMLEMQRKMAWVYPFMIGLLIFFCIWIKLSYFAVLPGVVCLIAYRIISNRRMFGHSVKFRTLFWHIVILLAMIIIPSFILFNSRDINNHKFYEFLYMRTRMFQFSSKWSLFDYFIHPLMSTHKIFSVSKSVAVGVDLANILILFAILIFGAIKLYLKRISFGFAVLNFCLFIVTYFFILLYSPSWAASHTALSLPFLVLSLFYIVSRLRKDKVIVMLLIAFLTVNACYYYHLTKLSYHMNNHPGLMKINTLLNKNFARRYVFIAIDWGIYYIQSLYGDKSQCVLYMEPLVSKEQIDNLKKILYLTKRKALFIGRVDSVSNLSLIREKFPTLVELKTEFDTGDWRVWYDIGGDTE